MKFELRWCTARCVDDFMITEIHGKLQFREVRRDGTATKWTDVPTQVVKMKRVKGRWVEESTAAEKK